MSSSEQRFSLQGNIALNLVMVDDTIGGVIVLEYESNEASVDKPEETWEWLLT